MKQENIAAISKLTLIQHGSFLRSRYTCEAEMYFVGWTLNQEWIVAMFRWTRQDVIDQHSIPSTTCCREDLDQSIRGCQARRSCIDLDWSDLPSVEQEARRATWLQADRKRGFA